jgi:hypothetical protein
MSLVKINLSCKTALTLRLAMILALLITFNAYILPDFFSYAFQTRLNPPFPISLSSLKSLILCELFEMKAPSPFFGFSE